MTPVLASLLAVLAAQPQPAPNRSDSLLRRLLRIAGLTAAPSQMRGADDEVASGDIWVADLEAQTAVPITKTGGYRWPVFALGGEGAILAVRDDLLVRIAPDGTTRGVPEVRHVVKLVGFDEQNPDLLLVVVGGGHSPLGMLSLRNKRVTTLPFDAHSIAHRQMLQHVLGQERDYGSTRLYVKSQSRPGPTRTVEWTDVYLKRPGALPQNVSDCEGVDCGQPSLSQDGQKIVFIKSSPGL